MYTLTPFFYQILERSKTESLPKKIYRQDRNFRFPQPDVVREGERFSIIESEAEFSHSVTIVHPNKITLSVKEMGHLPHDYVLSKFRALTERDLQFSLFFDWMDDGRDTSSPDLIFKDDGRSFILEVGTTLGNVESYYSKKYDTYQDAIATRCGSNYTYFIIVVSRNTMMTNLPLTPDEAEDIFVRYNYGQMIKQQAIDTGARLDHDDEMSQIKEEIELNLFDKINRDVADPHDILFVDETSLAEYDEVEIPPYLNDVVEVAKEDFIARTDPKNTGFDIDAFIEENYKIDGLKMNKKAVVPFPMFDCDKVSCTMTEYVDSMAPIEDMEGYYGRLWAEARLSMMGLIQDDYINDNLSNMRTREEKEYNINTARKFREPEFMSRGRMILKMDYDMETFFAERGLKGKKHKENIVLMKKREETKKGFHWDTDVSDIEKFLNRNDLFEVYDEDERNPIEYSLLPLYTQYFSKIKSTASEKFRMFLRTKIGRMLTVFSSIAAELNVNIRKPTRGNEWLITYNRIYGFPILIKNTGSSKHTFFSVLVKKEDMLEQIGLPFAEMIDLGNYYCSPLLSTRNHDLSMHIGLITKFYATYMTMTDVCGEAPEISPNFRFNKEMLSMLLIAAENKEKTSAPLQNVRYMYMDLLTTQPTNSNPFKVITKFDTIIRNRLILFFMKKIVVAFKIMLDNKRRSDMLVAQNVYDDADEIDNDSLVDDDAEKTDLKIPLSQDQVNGMISFISFKQLKSYEEALNLSYMGVFHEKDKNEESQGFWKIFSKVMKEEIKMRPGKARKEYMGYAASSTNWEGISVKDLRSHEFSVPHVKMIGRTIKAKIKSQGISDSALKDLILTNLSKVCFEQLATFKASAEYRDFTSGDLEFFGYESKKRRKCLSAILDLMEEIGTQGRCPFTSFKKLFKLFKRYGGMIANLFKKNQLTGIREIFVLYIHARVVVNFLETVSRTICEIMPNEYLTKGTEKLNAITQHYNKVASESRFSIGGKKTISETVSDSADATTWCQRFVMPVFSVMFNEIFGDFWGSMNNTLQSILNEVTFKRLEMPKKLLDLIFEHQDTYSLHDEGMNEFQKQFLRHENDHNDLNNGFSMFLKNRSNFMQGILHYTSSLVHSGHLLLFSKWMEKLCQIRFGEKTVKVITTTLCSSDDATRISTIIFQKGNPLLHKRILLFLTFSSSIFRCSYPLFTAQLSDEKSTLANLTKVCEFNSVWFFRNTMLTPKIKWAFASQQYKVSSSPVDRQLQDHNLINDMIANGCSTVVANDVQFACLINHYDCIGLFTQNINVFHKMVQEIATIKHPIGWFYFLSNPMTSTALGYQYTKYWNLKQFDKTRMAEVISRKSLVGETTDIGGRSYSVKMRVGDSHKYYKFINEEIKSSVEEVEAEIKKDPEFMFRQSKVISEERLKILAKAHAPGAEKSFSFDSGAKQHSQCSYIMSKPCITVSSKEEKFKCSLTYLTDYIIKQLCVMQDSDFEFTYVQFPQMDLYSKLEERLKEYHVTHYPVRHRRIKSKVKLPKSKIENLSPLKHVLATYWFNHQPRTSRSMYTMSLKSYLIEFPWIKETFNESLDSFKEAFGDISILEFISFILNVEEREPTIEFLFPGRRKAGALNTLVECFIKNYGRTEQLMRLDRRKKSLDRILSLSSDTYILSIHEQLNEMETILARAKTLYSDTSRSIVMNYALSKQNIVALADLDEYLLTRIERKLQPLLIMSCIHNEPDLNKVGALHIMTCFKRLNMGMLIWYKQEQRKIGGKYIGDGLIDIVLPTAQFTLLVREDVVTEIFASNKGKVHYYATELATVITKTLNLRTRTDADNHGMHSASFEAVGQLGKYRENSSRGTPIRPMRENVIVPESIQVKIELNKSADLCLKIKTGSTYGESLRFSAKPRLEEISPAVLPLVGYETKWLNNKKFSGSDLKEILNEAENDDEIKEWVMIGLNSRMMAMGDSINNKTALEFNLSDETDYNLIDLNLDYGEVQTQMDDLDLMNMGMDLDYDTLGFELAAAEQDTTSFVTGSDFIELEDYEVFGYSRRIRPSSKTSYFFSCCSFDTIIELFKKVYNKKLSEMYATGYTDKVKGDALRLVKLLGMKSEDQYIELDENEETFEF